MWIAALKSRWLPWSLLLVSVASGLLSTAGYNWQKIARQNAEAARDSTRSISTRQGEVYARLLAQKDVELSGALATAAHLRRLHPVAQVGVIVGGRGVDTSVTHVRGTRSPVVSQPGNGTVTRPDASRADLSVYDSLVFRGPPVEGVVSVAVHDSTIFWAASLKPSPIPLSFSIGCGKSGAELTARGPSWVEIQVQPGQVEPRVCNPPRLRRSIPEKVLTATGAVFVIVKVIRVVKSIVH